jgi:hypothetical protein
MKVPEPLSPAARRLLELGSVVEPPTSEQNARMDRALAPLLGPGRTSGIADASAPARAERLRLSGGRLGAELAAGPGAKLRLLQRSLQQRLATGGAQVALALGTLGATAGASFWLGRASTPDVEQMAASVSAPAFAPPVLLEDASEPAPSRPPAPVPDATEAAPPRPAPPPEAVVVPSATEPAATPASARVVARQSNGHIQRDRTSSRASLAVEIERMGRVEAALRQGQPARALEYLERREIQILVEQAAALRAVASCQSGAESSARAAQETLRRWPSSPFGARIREACGL